ncbi:MAG: thiamine diphosphokinase [Candidatus Kapabacteria bacterium]|nr:thiamine diphosphokinase [Candidatus Kapabacteria bacterium]
MSDKFVQLKFDSEFDAIICLNGKIPTKNFFKKCKNVPILASDGASTKLFKINIIPDYVIGDMDSAIRALLDKFIPENRIIEISSQDITDFEKTLNFSIKSGFENILICGFHGGEMEHSLNNVSVLLKYMNSLNLTIFELNRYCLPINKSIQFHCSLNEMISIIPQPECDLNTDGLQWELKNESLKLGTREGSRNRAIKTKVSIKLNSGKYLLSINSILLKAPNFYN